MEARINTPLLLAPIQTRRFCFTYLLEYRCNRLLGVGVA